DNGRKLLKIMTAEMTITFVLLIAVIFGMTMIFEIIPEPSFRRNAAFALLFAAIGVVHSPAVTMALLSETGARGPVARTTLGVVLISDVAVVLFFTAILFVAKMLVPATSGEDTSIWFVLWEIGGALLVGGVVG